jgi:hypothetical protein
MGLKTGLGPVGATVLFLAAFGTVFWSLRRVVGRIGPRFVIAPVIFLATRWPVLIVSAAAATGMFLLLISSAIAHGHDTLHDFAELGGIALLCGGGLAMFLVGMPFFLVRAFTRAPAFELEMDERVLDERAANDFLGGEGRGGKLMVTTRRLVFRPHRFNVQLDLFSVRLDEVRSLEVAGDRFLVVGTGPGKRPRWLVLFGPQLVAAYLVALKNCPEAERAASNDKALRAGGLR